MQKDNKNQDNVKQTILKEAKTLNGWPEIRGYDFEEDFNFENFMKSFLYTGFQATNLGKAIQIVKNMQRDNAKIFLAFTSNMGTCGVREQIKYLVKHKKIYNISTTIGSIEEDIIKCFKPFVIGEFNAKGIVLREDGINRTGNIFIPNDRYIYFDKFMRIFLERIYELQIKTNIIIGIKEFVYELGKELELQDVENKEDSFTYWAYKNKLDIFCPAILDGSVGDMVYFFKQRNPDFKIDTSDYITQITNQAINCEKMAILAIGGSIPKHMVANAGLFRDGAEYAIYINTGLEMEGSNAGAPIDEAISWGKIKHDSQSVKLDCEASIVFPLLVACGFKLYNNE